VSEPHPFWFSLSMVGLWCLLVLGTVAAATLGVLLPLRLLGVA
jgi:hypothetical protein